MSYPEHEEAESHYDLLAGPDNIGQRLDQFLGKAEIVGEEISRSFFKKLISDGMVFVNGNKTKVGYRLRRDDCINVRIPPPQQLYLSPEKVAFDTLFEDSDIIVLSKPPGIVVHPACGHSHGTLVHGLLYHCRDLAAINGTIRPGIVHRLDRETSGVMVAAKNDRSYHKLVQQFKDRKVEKIYLAIVRGRPKQSRGTIVTSIGRHPVQRKKMAVLEKGGREAVTHYYLKEKLGDYSLLELRLETGRTHQIRVHLAHIDIPIAGDKVYGHKRNKSKQFLCARHCLHASVLAFYHPQNGVKISFVAPLWPDMDQALSDLRVSTTPKLF